jgi:hypothetical protein
MSVLATLIADVVLPNALPPVPVCRLSMSTLLLEALTTDDERCTLPLLALAFTLVVSLLRALEVVPFRGPAEMFIGSGESKWRVSFLAGFFNTLSIMAVIPPAGLPLVIPHSDGEGNSLHSSLSDMTTALAFPLPPSSTRLLTGGEDDDSRDRERDCWRDGCGVTTLADATDRELVDGVDGGRRICASPEEGTVPLLGAGRLRPMARRFCFCLDGGGTSGVGGECGRGGDEEWIMWCSIAAMATVTATAMGREGECEVMRVFLVSQPNPFHRHR